MNRQTKQSARLPLLTLSLLLLALLAIVSAHARTITLSDISPLTAGDDASTTAEYHGENATLNFTWTVNGVIVFHSWDNNVTNGSTIPFTLSHSYYIAGDTVTADASAGNATEEKSALVAQAANGAAGENDTSGGFTLDFSPGLIAFLLFIVLLFIGAITAKKAPIWLAIAGIYGTVYGLVIGATGTWAGWLITLVGIMVLVVSIKL
jgi:archaellum component FlaF (FlaF/FlaG flagellin family)